MSTRFVIIDAELHYKLSGTDVSIPQELQKSLDDLVKEFFSKSAMRPPSNTALPFFAYGLFKPGQLGFDSIRDWAKEVSDASVMGALFERDGVPLFVDRAGCATGEVGGALITFVPERAEEAYQSIALIEPKKQYCWDTRTTTTGVKANVLVSNSQKGAYQLEQDRWDGRKDPILVRAPDLALEIENNTRECQKDDRLLYLQMAYMLLWTAIERYTSLRYHLGKNVMGKIMRMAEEPAFQTALKTKVVRIDKVYSTDAGSPKKLDPADPKKSLDYYYQVRCNATHRGKAMLRDEGRLVKCIDELAHIFMKTRDGAFEACKRH